MTQNTVRNTKKLAIYGAKTVARVFFLILLFFVGLLKRRSVLLNPRMQAKCRNAIVKMYTIIKRKLIMIPCFGVLFYFSAEPTKVVSTTLGAAVNLSPLTWKKDKL